jgi:hypothetical protein
VPRCEEGLAALEQLVGTLVFAALVEPILFHRFMVARSP